jgi:hypothetical protein
MAMLADSSTSTATMFCCGFRVATTTAGCHKSTRISAASRDCSAQTVNARAPITSLPPRRHTRYPIAAAEPAISSARIQAGQPPSSTTSPLEKTAAGYLKKNSNIS